MVVQMLTILGKRMDNHSENISRERGKRNKTELIRAEEYNNKNEICTWGKRQ